MRVLFVNHTSQISGAEHSLLELLRALPPGLEGELACPPGSLFHEAQRRGHAVHRIEGTDGSLRLHPLHTPRAAGEIARAALEIRRLTRLRQIDLVHANSIRAGIAAGLAGPRATPLVTHVRDCLPPGTVSAATMGLLGARSSILIANSAYTRERCVPARARERTEVVHSPVDLDRFDPAPIDRDAARRALELAPGAPVLGVVAQITPWKGQIDAVRLMGEILGEHPDATLLLVGSAKFTSGATRYDNTAYLAEIQREIASRGLGRNVRLIGERADVPVLLRALDVLLAPSWEEPFGRSVVEAMAMGVPVVVTDRGGPAEIVRDGRDGRLAPPRDPQAWSSALAPLLASPELRAAMGASGRERARAKFGVPMHVARVVRAYERARSGARCAC